MTTKVSDVKRWPGSIELPEFMTFKHLSQWEKALAAARKNSDDQQTAEFYMSLIPAIIEIVTKWDIVGLDNPPTPQEFPASPRLVSWLIGCVTELYTATNEDGVDPN